MLFLFQASHEGSQKKPEELKELPQLTKEKKNKAVSSKPTPTIPKAQVQRDECLDEC